MTADNYTGMVKSGAIYPIELTKSFMNIVDFSDDAPTPANAAGAFDENTPRKYLISNTDHYRQFDLLNSDVGPVHALRFIYTPESEISLSSFTLQGVGTTWSAQPMPSLGADNSYHITPTLLSMLFEGNTTTPHDMAQGERIRIIETYKVVACSPPAPTPNDSTVYSIIWDCADDPAVDHGCNHDTTTRLISVETSTGEMSASLSISPALDFCGGAGSSIFVNFNNSTFDKSIKRGPSPYPDDKLDGSNEKTLHSITFPVKLDVFKSAALNSGDFPTADIYLVGNTKSVPLVNLPTGFYTYSGAPDYHVVLNFNLLKN